MNRQERKMCRTDWHWVFPCRVRGGAENRDRHWSDTDLAVALLSPVSIMHQIVNASTRYKPPAIIAMDSPNPNTNSERSVIQARMLFDTSFTLPSIEGLLLPCTLPARSPGVRLPCMSCCAPPFTDSFRGRTVVMPCFMCRDTNHQFIG